MTETRVEKLGDRVYAIDAYMDGRPGRLACYLFDTPQRTLVEVGPSSTMHHLANALTELGIDDLATIVVTHVHIDHAGGTGHLAQHFPNARVGVHEAGARHLLNPDRLWRSAARIYGEAKLREMWGTMKPIATERMAILEEGSTVELGDGRYLDVLYTPGHAKHHVAYHDSEDGGIFVGDSLGACYPHGHLVMPLTPPPDFDPHEAASQMHRMAAREPRFVGYAHFGPAYDVAHTFAEAEERMWSWVRVVSSFGDIDDEAAAERLRKWTLEDYRSRGADPGDLARYDELIYWPMQVTGIRRWLAQRSRQDRE